MVCACCDWQGAGSLPVSGMLYGSDWGGLFRREVARALAAHSPALHELLPQPSLLAHAPNGSVVLTWRQSVTPSLTATITVTPSPSPTVTDSDSATPTGSLSASPSVSCTATPPASGTGSLSATPSHSPSGAKLSKDGEQQSHASKHVKSHRHLSQKEGPIPLNPVTCVNVNKQEDECSVLSEHLPAFLAMVLQSVSVDVDGYTLPCEHAASLWEHVANTRDLLENATVPSMLFGGAGAPPIVFTSLYGTGLPTTMTIRYSQALQKPTDVLHVEPDFEYVDGDGTVCLPVYW